MGKVKELLGQKRMISLNSVIDFDIPSKVEFEEYQGHTLSFEVWTLVLRSGLEVTFKLYGPDGMQLERMLDGLEPRRPISIASEQILNETKLF